MAMWIKTSGEIVNVSPENGSDFTGEELHEFVGGWFEIVGTADGRIMAVNEEGKLRGLPVNSIATGLYEYGNDIIVGDVLVCNDDEIK